MCLTFGVQYTRWVWDGNVPIHEWCYKAIGLQSDEEKNTPPKEPAEDITTWVFEAGTFVPTAKIQGDKQYSIVSDYMGTPIQMYDGQGNKTWDCTLDIYGKVLAVDKGTEFDCSFRFQGQYADEETGLFYNRFRFYDPNSGNYLSQDPIRLIGNNPTLYSYVLDTNFWIDIFGLKIIPTVTKGPNNEILTASATISIADIGTGSATNMSSRNYARKLGNADDDAGHIIGKLLGGSGGKKNIFPQDSHVNRGKFAQFEGDVAEFVDLHGKADIKITFEYANGGTRPTRIHYEATAPNGQTLSKSFDNHH